MTRLSTIGTIGRDADIKQVNGCSVINFPIARTETYKIGGESRSKTLWLECSIWTEREELLELLKKGKLCYVDGLPEVKPFREKPGAVLTLRVDKFQVIESESLFTTMEKQQ